MKPSERLYLSKQGDQVYIDVCDLPQHQIDGIRFIYRQFKKNNQGVILNDPSGYGKDVQVVLFLNATRNMLSQSVLILCKEVRANNWVQNFQKWTSFDDNEILIESFNPNKNKMLICINTIKNIAQFAKRTWSFVIVDGDNEYTKDILKTKFKANFKIWITPQDMKENLKMFSQIHNWLKPDDDFNMDNFLPNKKNVQDVVAKSILLDAFMQDVVLRRNGFTTPSKQTSNVKPKLSRKNKDITGTKIKRSKKTTDKGTDEEVKTPDIDVNMLSEVKNIEVVARDVETFISEVKPIALEAQGEQQYMNDYENNNDNGTSRVESDTSIDNNVSHTSAELNSSNNSSICTNDTNGLNKSSTDVINISNNEDIESSEVVETVTNKSHKTIDVLMKEMEEKTMKKFKGSFLDNMF